MKRKGFESEAAARAFAETVNGEVRFSPLPDYMGVTPPLDGPLDRGQGQGGVHGQGQGGVHGLKPCRIAQIQP